MRGSVRMSSPAPCRSIEKEACCSVRGELGEADALIAVEIRGAAQPRQQIVREDAAAQLVRLRRAFSRSRCAQLDAPRRCRRRRGEAEGGAPRKAARAPGEATGVDEGEVHVGGHVVDGAAQVVEGQVAAGQMERAVVSVAGEVEDELHMLALVVELGGAAARLGQGAAERAGRRRRHEDHALAPHAAKRHQHVAHALGILDGEAQRLLVGAAHVGAGDDGDGLGARDG